jgi:hypothetical protein
MGRYVQMPLSIAWKLLLFFCSFSLHLAVVVRFVSRFTPSHISPSIEPFLTSTKLVRCVDAADGP